MQNLPKKIYLNTGVEDFEFDFVDFNDCVDVPWCTEPVGEGDIEYRLVEKNKITTIEEVEAEIKDIYLHDGSGYELVKKYWFKIHLSLGYKEKGLFVQNYIECMEDHPISNKSFKGETLQEIFDQFSEFLKVILKRN